MTQAVRRMAPWCAIAGIMAGSTLNAGGPLSTIHGKPVKYRTNGPVVYHLDKGPMGSFSPAVARTIAIQSFAVWENVPTAVIAFKTDSLAVDVTGSNFPEYLRKYEDGINPIIFDSDGSIIDAIYGEGSSSDYIGFAGSSHPVEGADAEYYVEGHAVLNGVLAGDGIGQFNEARFKSTFVHEFGHFIGLDHTQVNTKFGRNGNVPDDIYIPTMYAFSTDDDTELGNLNPDDIAAVSTLYPSADFTSTTSRITGTVIRQDGSAVRGANVVAYLLSDSLMTQVSTVSDYLMLGTGAYSISGLSPGEYAVRVEPIETRFVRGSSVGPYADNGTGLSFIDPVIPEWYNGANESGDPTKDTARSWVRIIVTAGTATTANIIANGEVPAPTSGTLAYFGTPTWGVSLPSRFGDTKYAVRFTPGANSQLTNVEFAVNKVRGNGTLRISVHENLARSSGGVPGAQIGSAITIPSSSLIVGDFNAVDLSSQRITFQAFVNFHVAFEVLGTSGDTVQFVVDDALNPTNRSTSYFVPRGSSEADWYTFDDLVNFGTGYNLVIRTTVGELTDVAEPTMSPGDFIMGQNFPNPFNPSTRIPFKISKEDHVTLEVFDLLGRKVRTILNGVLLQAGDHTAEFLADGLPSGTYVAVLNSASQRRFVRMLLLR